MTRNKRHNTTVSPLGPLARGVCAVAAQDVAIVLNGNGALATLRGGWDVKAIDGLDAGAGDWLSLGDADTVRADGASGQAPTMTVRACPVAMSAINHRKAG